MYKFRIFHGDREWRYTYMIKTKLKAKAMQ